MYRHLPHLIFAVAGLCVGILIPEDGHLPLGVALASFVVLSILLTLSRLGFRPAEETIVGSVVGEARKRIVLHPTDVAPPGEGLPAEEEIEFGADLAPAHTGAQVSKFRRRSRRPRVRSTSL